MYHYVREIKNSTHPNIKGLEVTAFRNQLDYLIKNYNIISADQLSHSLNTQDALPNNPCLLSFDDGYADHYEYAFPMLMDRGLTGAFYPSAITSTENVVLDINKVHYLMDQVPDIHILVSETVKILDTLRQEHEIESTESLYAKYAKANRFDNKDVIFFKRLLQLGLPEEHRKSILQNLIDRFMPISELELSKELYATQNQLKEMHEHGMHIGSHCYDHYWLNTLSETDQEVQIIKSLDFLSNIGSQNNWSIAYPSGGYNDHTLKILKNMGCQFGLTTFPEIYDLNSKKRFEISRLDTNDFPK